MEPVGTPEAVELRLVVGLGNPGHRYEATRHNIGFMVIDRLARRVGAIFENSSRWQAQAAALEGGRRLCKPVSFMNRSGEPVRAMSDFYRIAPSQILVVYDDAALPLGRLRLRRGGSAGGHNGMQSIIDHLGTRDIARLRVGIGSAVSSGEMTGHVLGRFSEDEKEAVEAAVERAADAVESVASSGLEAAMNLHNQNQTSS